MKIGFTGTRQGMTDQQKKWFTAYIVSNHPTEFHHGDCVGADDEAADIVHEYAPECRIICHQPIDDYLRAFNPHSNELREAKTHFARNRDIVDETDVLVGTPAEMQKQARGGTWYTITYAEKRKRPVVVLWPLERSSEDIDVVVH